MANNTRAFLTLFDPDMPKYPVSRLTIPQHERADLCFPFKSITYEYFQSPVITHCSDTKPLLLCPQLWLPFNVTALMIGKLCRMSGAQLRSPMVEAPRLVADRKDS